MVFPVDGNRVFLSWSYCPLNTMFKTSLGSGMENKAMGALFINFPGSSLLLEGFYSLPLSSTTLLVSQTGDLGGVFVPNLLSTYIYSVNTSFFFLWNLSQNPHPAPHHLNAVMTWVSSGASQLVFPPLLSLPSMASCAGLPDQSPQGPLSCSAKPKGFLFVSSRPFSSTCFQSLPLLCYICSMQSGSLSFLRAPTTHIVYN